MVKVVDRSHNACQSTPDRHDSREVQGRFPPHKDHVGRWFESHVCNEEDYQSNGVFIRGESEVVGHACNLGVSDAGDALSVCINGNLQGR